jgi:hypothetical protein
MIGRQPRRADDFDSSIQSSELRQDSPYAIAQATVERNTNAASFMRILLCNARRVSILWRPTFAAETGPQGSSESNYFW